MKKYLSLAFGLLLVALLIRASQDSKPQEKATSRTLRVTVHYSGSGTVDEKHKIFVVLWDSPDFVQPANHSTPPMAVKPTAMKDGMVSFSDFSTSPVYVSAAYDPSGNWDAQSPPPTGSSLGLYGKTPGKPEPIKVEPGETASVELSFDDTTKMK